MKLMRVLHAIVPETTRCYVALFEWRRTPRTKVIAFSLRKGKDSLVATSPTINLRIALLV